MLRDTIRVANPLSEEAPLLTTTLLPGLLETTARNLGRGRNAVGIFETAPVFVPTPDRRTAPILGVDRRPDDAELAELLAAVPRQPLTLGVVLAGDRQAVRLVGPGPRRVLGGRRPGGPRARPAAAVDVEVVQATREPWHPGRCARLLVAGGGVGHAGELHPVGLPGLRRPRPHRAVEIDLDLLIGHAPTVQQAPTVSTYPVAKEDVALVVDADVPAGPLAATAARGGGGAAGVGAALRRLRGDQVGEGRKSLAFALRFRAPDRTLTEAEAGAARDAAVALAARAARGRAALSRFGAGVRGTLPAPRPARYCEICIDVYSHAHDEAQSGGRGSERVRRR